MDKLILVLYIDVGAMDNEEIQKHVLKISSTLFNDEIKNKLDATTFTIPIRGGGTRIECINPKFIVDADLMKEHRLKLDVLNENLDHFISQLKDGK